MVVNEVSTLAEKKKVKAFKINDTTEDLIEVFEIIYTEKAKSKAFRYGIQHNDSLFQYQKYEEYYTKIFTDLIKNGVSSFDKLRGIVSDFDNVINENRSSHTKSLELRESTVEQINDYTKDLGLKGQEFILQSLERTIIRNNLDTDYLRELYLQVEKNRENQ